MEVTYDITFNVEVGCDNDVALAKIKNLTSMTSTSDDDFDMVTAISYWCKRCKSIWKTKDIVGHAKEKGLHMTVWECVNDESRQQSQRNVGLLARRSTTTPKHRSRNVGCLLQIE
jgi:hypothetical protein